MKSIVGTSSKKNPSDAIAEATSKISAASGIIFFTDYDRLAEISRLLQEKYPKAQIIGTSGTAYYNTLIAESGLLIVTAITEGAAISSGVIEKLSDGSLSDIYRLKKSADKVNASGDNSVCLEFCTNDEESLVSTMNAVLVPRGISLAGGSVHGTPAGKPPLVACFGSVYSDACAYMIVKNQTGKVHVIKENIYDRGESAVPHIATKVNLKTKEVIQFDGRPAAEVYSKETGVPKEKIVDNVLKQPLGRIVEDEIFISSMNGVGSNGAIRNYKRINEDDTIYFLELLDYHQINEETRRYIADLTPHPSLIFSVNCIYRYLLFRQDNYLDKFLKLMSETGNFVGYIGGGEQYNRQHVNQTMVCAVFD